MNNIYQLREIFRVKVWKKSTRHKHGKVSVQRSQAQQQYECLTRDGRRKLAREMRSKAISILELYVLNKNKCVISQLRLNKTGDLSNEYSVFMAVPLHLLHLGILNKLKICTAAYLS